MAEQQMEVISGASHGSYSFIQDNYIYRINKLTHKRVYLSCRLGHCRGAGKGLKGATRGEIYNFKISKPHNHPPEENKIRHFEVKEFVREEARCSQDTSKEIYERAVKLFNCYDLSRACVNGLVKRSRERSTDEVAEKRVGRSHVPHEENDARKQMIPSSEDASGNEADASSGEVYESVEGLEDHNDEHMFEVVIEREGEQFEPNESAVEYVDEGVEKEANVLSADRQELVLDEQDPSDSDTNPDERYVGEHPSSESDSSVENRNALVVPSQRQKRSDRKLMNESSQRLQQLRRRRLTVGATNSNANRQSLKRFRLSDSEDDKPNEKHLSVEESLLKIFSSTYFSSKDNVFDLLSNPESIPGDEDEQNALSSTNCLNIIKSASKLCTFTAVKASQMKNLVMGKTRELHMLEDVLLEHLSNLMCFSGTEFFQKCFGRSLREAVERGKNEDSTKYSIWNEDEILGTSELKNEKVQLAVALLCYSGKAYCALGELIDLPGAHIARKWATNSVGNPGFSAQPFALIRKEVSVSRSKTIFVCLSMEDVSLKREVDSSGDELFGYTDLGYGRVESDSIPEATRAVIFYATAINSHWKVPLGYCLTDTLSPQVRANLLSQYVSKLEFSGVKCAGLVLTNSTTSTHIYEEFGVILKGALPLGSFHTVADEKIRVSPFVDILEAMTSVKQLWKEKRTFFTPTGDEISWSHFEIVQEFVHSESSVEVLKPGTYSMDFMNFLKFLKIKIQKESWPFGRFFLVAMKILKKHGPNELQDSGPTITFIEHMVEITEIFTSCHRFDESKIRLVNDKSCFTAINKIIHYLENMKFASGNYVRDEARRMPIMQLCMNLSSLKIVLKRVYCKKDGLFHRVSLSGVKEFISEMRTSNELLTPAQFRDRYLNYIQSLKSSPSANLCRRTRLTEKVSGKFQIDFTFCSSKFYIYVPLRSMCDQVSTFFVEKVVNVWIDAVDCPECFQVMLDSMQNELSGLHRDLVRLIQRVERELCVMGEVPTSLVDREFHPFANKILNDVVSYDGFKLHDHLFVSAEFGSVCHFTYLVKDLIEIYLRLRLMYLAREVRIGINDFHVSSLKYSLGQFWA